MQPQNPRYNYLLAEVATATPQKLQLLLIEAAMKNIYRVKALWAEEKYDIAFDSLVKAQDIVAEILCSFDRENSPDLAGKLSAIYVFIFRRLAEGGMSHNPEKLDDALRVLASERETWRLVCEKFGASNDSQPSTSPSVTAGKPGGGGSGAWASAIPVGSSAPQNAPAKPAAATPVPVPSSAPAKPQGMSAANAVLPTGTYSPASPAGTRPLQAFPTSPKPLQPIPLPPNAPVAPKTLADFAPVPPVSGAGTAGPAKNLLDPQSFTPQFQAPKREK